jgi:hypothetical protein
VREYQETVIGGRTLFARIAKVESVRLEMDRALTLWVMLDYGGACQGFGGYSLDQYHEDWKRRRGTGAGLDYLIQLLNLFGVSRLEEIKGRVCYALFEDENYNSTVKGLLTTPPEGGKWFLVSEWVREWGLE